MAQVFYAVAAVVGLVATWYYNLQVFSPEVEASFLELLYSNPASAGLTNDILVVVAVFVFWSWFEAKRVGLKHWWAYMLVTFTVAIAVAFPLFLLMRERALEKQSEAVL